VLCGLAFREDPNLLIGMKEPDDAGVYKISEEVALIQTVDFFTPLVDDPYTFGQIAATNSLSDVYAMGGKPLTCMNILCFPMKKLGASIAREIIRGGLDKINEAGAVLVGGHSVVDDELKYGLSVTGTVHPGRILTKGGARVGDLLILTKALGTGIIATALKGGMASDAAVSRMIVSMTGLNKRAAELIAESSGVHCCTDITGFGLTGHLYEMLNISKKGATLSLDAIPLMEEARKYAEEGLVPGGLYRNRDFYAPHVIRESAVSEQEAELLCDPQTSGGLLVALEPHPAEKLLKSLKEQGIADASIIGVITDDEQAHITLSRTL
jgi:selenide, water dikinase